ncbi:hypothetical protein BLM14_29545 (plasmid) [Phyllobacterium zundukense]|nr:hypothetical protein BLM14_29545 [Phyllobacterium zundukense]
MRRAFEVVYCSIWKNAFTIRSEPPPGRRAIDFTLAPETECILGSFSRLLFQEVIDRLTDQCRPRLLFFFCEPVKFADLKLIYVD